ncbi:MAG: TA system VapC family ribonuclease toxin [Vicinamibacterales bacterium]
MVHLLDVNVLVALFDADHVHHEAAHDWFADHRADGWATCPSTESGFARVVSHPAYGSGLRVAEAADHLRRFRASGHHVFWADGTTLSDTALFRLERLHGHREVSDVCLLGLAVSMGGRLATFDRAIPVNAVHGATPDSVAVIGPADL